MMLPLSRLLATLACCSLLSGTALADPILGPIEVYLVFPRNETYAPASRLPLVFALKNPEVAKILNPSISFDVWSSKTNMSKNFGDTWYLRWANFSSADPFFYYHGFTNYDTEDHWTINWRFEYDNCVESPRRLSTVAATNSSGGRLEFTTAKSASAAGHLDLASALRDDHCSASSGSWYSNTSIDVYGAEGRPADWWMYGGDYCGLVRPSRIVASNPCDVAIPFKAAESIAARVTADVCLETDKPLGCMTLESGAQRLSIRGAAVVAAALGGLTFMLRFV